MNSEFKELIALAQRGLANVGGYVSLSLTTMNNTLIQIPV